MRMGKQMLQMYDMHCGNLQPAPSLPDTLSPADQHGELGSQHPRLASQALNTPNEIWLCVPEVLPECRFDAAVDAAAMLCQQQATCSSPGCMECRHPHQR